MQIVRGKFCGSKHTEASTFTHVICQHLRFPRCRFLQQVGWASCLHELQGTIAHAYWDLEYCQEENRTVLIYQSHINCAPYCRSTKSGKNGLGDVAGCIRTDKQNLRLNEFEILFSWKAKVKIWPGILMLSSAYHRLYITETRQRLKDNH